MVASEYEKIFGILDLVSKQEADNLERLFTPVDIIPEEKIVGLEI